MAELLINSELCIGCALCVKSCANAALYMENEQAVLGSGCNMCGVCLQSCPQQAISMTQAAADNQDIAAYHGIWVFAEQDEQGILPVVFELLGKGRELANARGCQLCAVLAEAAVDPQKSRALIAAGADRVLRCVDPRFSQQLEAPYVDLLGQLVRSNKPEIVLFGATDLGRSLAPRLAARIGTGLTADCTMLEIDPQTGLLLQTRPAFGGNLLATIICANHRPQMASVRPGIMSAAQPDQQRQGCIIDCVCDAWTEPRIELLQTIPKTKDGAAITEAKIIVEAGRGVGSAKNLPLLEQLAQELNAAVGCSRPLVDMGWYDISHQIGQTGNTVAPDLLFSVGVSGAIQHLAGMSRAKTIVAINNSADEPIISVSRYALIGDSVELLKELLTQVQQRKNSAAGHEQIR